MVEILEYFIIFPFFIFFFLFSLNHFEIEFRFNEFSIMFCFRVNRGKGPIMGLYRRHRAQMFLRNCIGIRLLEIRRNCANWWEEEIPRIWQGAHSAQL